MKIAIGSKNPAKIAATRQAFTAIWPEAEFEISASDVASGVSNMPLSSEESIKGAINRAKTVRVSLRPDYAVGIEAGLAKIGDGWFEDAWVAVIDSRGDIGLGGSPRVEIAPELMKQIKAGKEFGEAAEIMFGPPYNQGGAGYVGGLTGKVFGRTDMLCDAVIMALGRFVRPEIFDDQA